MSNLVSLQNIYWNTNNTEGLLSFGNVSAHFCMENVFRYDNIDMTCIRSLRDSQTHIHNLTLCVHLMLNSETHMYVYTQVHGAMRVLSINCIVRILPIQSCITMMTFMYLQFTVICT